MIKFFISLSIILLFTQCITPYKNEQDKGPNRIAIIYSGCKADTIWDVKRIRIMGNTGLLSVDDTDVYSDFKIIDYNKK